MNVVIPGISTPIEGDESLIIIGPNGVGKTQLGAAISRNNNGERVAALRNVEIPEITMQRLETASQNVKNALNELTNQHWRQSFELQHLMSEILAEDRDSAVAYRKNKEERPSDPTDKALTNTRLARIVRIWNRHFPGRMISIDYQSTVQRLKPDGTQATYPISQMSEGERTALYLSARIVSCKASVMVVDEPETFFHPLLARNLWDDLETEAPNVRFVYITHDIPFALSRRESRILIARSENAAELLPASSSIPDDVVAEVLGAASFSISASRLIFCEGDAKSWDGTILGAWHTCPKTAVVAVGGCDSVRECVSVFREQSITAGVSAFGYVDRDSWPDAALETAFVRAHLFSEIESLFAVETVFKALAVYNGFDPTQAQAAYSSMIREARASFSGVTLNKEILNRAKTRVEFEQKAMLNPLKPNPDLSIVRCTFVNAGPDTGWLAYMAKIFNEEENRLHASLNGSDQEFIRDFPGKSYFTSIARHLKFLPEKMVEALCTALRLSDSQAAAEHKLKVLRDSIVPAMEDKFWPRTAP